MLRITDENHASLVNVWKSNPRFFEVSKIEGSWQKLTPPTDSSMQIRKAEVQDFFCPVPAENRFSDPPKVKLKDLIL